MSETIGLRVGRRLKRARESRGVSQQELAEALGLSQAAVSNIESGTRPLRVDELITASRILGEDPEYFLASAGERRGTVGVTLRAEVANLPLPDFASAINVFLDEIEDVRFPPTKISIKAREPAKAARETLQLSGREKLPIDVHAIARDLGVAVFLRPFPAALSALLLRHEENAFIGVSSHQAPVRQRFSIAHELGHFVLHHKDHHFIDYGVPQAVEGELPGYNWDHERAANQFAAELLMPADQVRADVGTTSLTRLARRYDVSQEAMGFRRANLGL